MAKGSQAPVDSKQPTVVKQLPWTLVPSEELYRLHVGATEWSLQAPVLLRSVADSKAKKVWQSRLEPFRHQVQNLITFCRRAPVALLADDVGLGKTVSAGLILAELMARGRVKRALVVAPKLLLPQWKEELDKKFAIKSEAVSGSEAVAAFASKTQVIVTTYHAFSRYADQIQPETFDLVIFDEAHKLRNLHGTKSPPKMATAAQDCLTKGRFRYVLMLTATPIQNRIWDLYSLVALLTCANGHKNPLGSPSEFRARYLSVDEGQERLNPKRRQEFQAELGKYIARTRRVDAKLAFPTRVVKTLRVEPSEPERSLIKLMMKLAKSHKNANALTRISLGTALMSSPIALRNQLRSMADSGTIDECYAEEAEEILEDSELSAKLLALEGLIKKLKAERPSDWRVVVFTSRKATQDMIVNHLRAAGVAVGTIRGGEACANELAIKHFCAKAPRVNVLVSTDAGSEGVNLQAANVLVNFDLPWNPMVLEQRIGRIQRLMSPHAEVVVFNLVLSGTVEEYVVEKILHKLQTVVSSIGDIEAILEATGQGDDQEDGDFEDQISELVFKSLAGADVEAATAKAMKSIDEAKQVYKAEQASVERALGELDAFHKDGPKLPNIDPQVPSMPPESFVVAALAAEGASVKPLGSGLLEVHYKGGGGGFFAVDEAAMDSAKQQGLLAPRECWPGSRDFEELARKWSAKAALLVHESPPATKEEIEHELLDWLSAHAHLNLVRATVGDSRQEHCGKMLLVGGGHNRYDRLERTIETAIAPEVLEQVNPDWMSWPTANVSVPSEAVRDLSPDAAGKSVGADAALSKFNRFYLERMKHELELASEESLESVRSKFVVNWEVTARAARLVRVVSSAISVTLVTAGGAECEARFEFSSAKVGAGRLRPTDEWKRCEATGSRYPGTFFGMCEVTGKNVALCELERCPVSSVRMCKSLMKVCEESGSLVNPECLLQCAVTQKLVCRGLLSKSAVSGVHALTRVMRKCEFTGAVCAESELEGSEISGRLFRADESARSTVSGRRGHRSEFVAISEPEGLGARDEVAQSCVSLRWGQRSRMIASDVASERLGLPSEARRCAVTGQTVLLDEVELSIVSGAPAIKSYLVPCDLTGGMCLPTELAVSEVSSKRVRSDQFAVSAVTGKRGHTSEFVLVGERSVEHSLAERSAVNGEWGIRSEMVESVLSPGLFAFPSEVVRSAETGRCCLPSQAFRSPSSGKLGLPDETVVCEFSNLRVLRDEVGRSEIGSRIYRLDEEVRSAKSGRVGHRSEFVAVIGSAGPLAIDEAVRSDLSGGWGDPEKMHRSDVPPARWGFPQEFVVSRVSSKRALLDECVRSQVSDAPMLQGEESVCDFTRAIAMPSEIDRSEVSGRMYRRDQSVRCVESGRRGHRSEFVSSVDPVGSVAVDLAVKSDLSGEWMSRSRAVYSESGSGRVGLKQETARCEVSGATLLRDELAKCAASGKLVGKDHLRASDRSGKLALPSELITCAQTGARLLPSEVGTCSITGSVVDSTLLAKSDLSESMALAQLMRTCPESGLRFLPVEGAKCEVTGAIVAPAVLVPCSITRRRGIQKTMRTCPTTGCAYIEDQVTRDRVRLSTGSEESLRSCSWSGGSCLATAGAICSLTGLWVSNAHLNPNGELSALRDILDGRSNATCDSVATSILRELVRLPGFPAKAVSAISVQAPDRKRAVLRVEVTHGLLGLGRRTCGVVLSLQKPVRVLGKAVLGKCGQHGWAALVE